MRAPLRPLLVGLALALLLACACVDPPAGTSPEALPAPVEDVDCEAQQSATEAGDDADVTDEPDGCFAATFSDSGDGDTASVQISDLGSGVFAIDLESVEAGGDDEDPTAYAEVEFVIQFAGGGEYLVFSAFDASTGQPAFVVGECTSGEETVPVVFRAAVPASPEGGSITCTVTAATPGAGTYRVLAGANVAPDPDGDGVFGRNDRCPFAAAPGDPFGCEESGVFAGVQYFCSDADTCFCDSFPTPCFCQECSVESDDLVASVAGEGPGDDLLIGSDGTIRCNGCTATSPGSAWRFGCSGASCVFEPGGASICDETDPLFGSPDGCDVRLGGSRLGAPLVNETIITLADKDAFDASPPLVASLDKTMSEGSGDGIFPFTLASAGRAYEAEIATDGGVGTTSLVLAFAGEASITENATPGFALVSHDCPGEGATATLTESATCEFLNEQLEVQGLVPIGVTGAETFSPLPSSFGPVAGSYFAVNGDNGFASYDAASFGVVSSLTRLGGFQYINVLGSLWIDDPTSPDDWLSGWNQGGGWFQTLWVSSFNDFGSTQIGFNAVLDGVHRGGDPNAETAVQVTSGAVRRLFFDDFGTGTNFLTSTTHVDDFDLATGYASASAFYAPSSDEVLIAARSTTPGQPGRAFRADSTTGFGAAIAAGDLGIDPRLLRCASAAPPVQVCVATPFGSTTANVLLWTPGVSAAVVDSISTGAGPLGLAVFAAGAQVRAAIANFTDDTLTLATLDGSTGAVVGSTTQPLQPGCTEPSSVLARGDGSLLVLCNGATAGQSAIAVVESPAFP